MSVVRRVRAELGEVLHVDYSRELLICRGGDLVRQVGQSGFKQDGPGRWVAGPRAWANYAQAHFGEDGDQGPILTWEAAAEVLGVTTATLRRQRTKHGDTAQPPWRSKAEVRTWYRELRAPKKERAARHRRQGVRKTSSRAQTLDELLQSR